MKLNSVLQKTIAVVLALLAWQAAASIIDEQILLVSPIQVVGRLYKLGGEPDFWQGVLFTFWRITLGFLSGLACGSVLAFFASKSKLIKTLLWPYMITIKSVPVASFIVLAIIILSSSAKLSVFISFLMVLPIIYTNLVTGSEDTNKKMLEMADIFRLSRYKRLLYITLPQIKPYLISACTVSIGLAWKSGVAAELIAQPNGSMGEALYQAKVHFDTADLFAWTVAIVICSLAFEKLFIYVLKQGFARLERL